MSGSSLSWASFVDSLFAQKNRHLVYLSFIFFLGLILRIIGALRLGALPDDLQFALHAINFISSGQLETFNQSSSLWFFLTDFFYSLFGISLFVSRLSAVLFGSFSILVFYLLVSYLFRSKNLGLLSAFFLAICPFAFKSVLSEMDSFLLFFLLFSLYFLFRGAFEQKNSFLYFSYFLLGVAILAKVYAILFLFPHALFLLFYWYRSQKESFSLKKVSFFFLFAALIIFVFLIPTLVHNLLLYSEKGFLDLQFTRVIGLGKDVSSSFYSYDAQFNLKFSFARLFLGEDGNPPALWSALKIFFFFNPLLFFFGVLGLFFLSRFKEGKHFLSYFILCFIPFAYLSAIILLSKHFIFFTTLFIIPASYAFYHLFKKFSSRKLFFFLSFFLLFSLVYASTPYSSNQYYYHSSPLYRFDSLSLPDDAFFVVDSRIYPAQSEWLLYGHPFLSDSFFSSLLEQYFSNLNSGNILPDGSVLVEINGLKIFLSSQVSSQEIYYLACLRHDCGWGTIKEDSPVEGSVAATSEFFRGDPSSTLVASFPLYSSNHSIFALPFLDSYIDYLGVYKTNLILPDGFTRYMYLPHYFLLYPVGYHEEEWFDKIHPGGFLSLLYFISRLILYVSLIFVFASVLLLFYYLKKSLSSENF